jgi:RNA polymerase sigma-70 factor (ECF subfamily)
MSAIARRTQVSEFEGLFARNRFEGEPRIAPPPRIFEDALSSELMRRFQRSQDESTFAQIYERNLGRIQRIVESCLRFGAPDVDAQEVTQNVFVSVFKSAHSFRFERDDSFRIWTAQIARNAVRHALRRRRERRQAEGSAVLEWLPAKTQKPEESQAIHDGEMALPSLLWVMAVALSQLLERDRAILLAADCDGEAYDSLAQRLRLRRATARMVVFRARRRLFQRMETILFGSRR